MTSPMTRGERRKWLRLAKAVVAHHLGSAPARIASQSGGITNFVYGVKHPEGEFILKMTPEKDKLDVFRKERLASEKARAAGVPTAEVLYVGDEAVPYPYMLQARVYGQPAMHHPERLKVLEQVGRYGAMINSIETEGFGHNFTQPPACTTWAAFLRDEIELTRRLLALQRHGMLDEDRAERLRALLESAGEGVAHGQLNHGDLRLKNVLVDDSGEITAIIDWENSLSALAPQWEWSIALHDLSIDAMEAFLTGYGASPEQIEAFAPVVKALNIVNYVPAIEHFVEQGEREPLGWIRTRMSGALDLYSV